MVHNPSSVYHFLHPCYWVRDRGGDESAVGIGEMSLTIGDETLTIAMATGLEIQEDSIATIALPEISAEEFQGLLEEGSTIPEGLRIFTDGHLYFLFSTMSIAESAPILCVMGSMGDLLAPTLLFSPEQVSQGLHEKAFAAIEEEAGLPKSIPRLDNGGLAPAEK